MSREELNEKVLAAIREKFGEKIRMASVEYDMPVAFVERDAYVDLIQWLKEDPEWKFIHFIDITSVDYKGQEKEKGDRFEVVVHLRSPKHNFKIRVKTPVNGEKPVIPSLNKVFIGSHWTEREIFDLMGIRFEGHPRMTRLLNPDDFVGHPLRKDFPVKGMHRGSFPKGSVISNKRREPVMAKMTHPKPLDQLLPTTLYEEKESPLLKEGNKDA